MVYQLTVLCAEYFVLYLANSQTLYVSVMVDDSKGLFTTHTYLPNSVPSAISWRCDLYNRLFWDAFGIS